MKKAILTCLMCFILTACNNKTDELTCKDYEKMLENDAILIDVRSNAEYNNAHLDNSINIPVEQVERIEKNYKKDDEIIIYCQSGSRAQQAVDHLIEKGFTNVHNYGGIDDCKK